MLIPKGLIPYRASRHHQHFPSDQKYGSHSNKLCFSFYSAKVFDEFKQRHHKKHVQEIHLRISNRSPQDKEIGVLRILPKYSHVTKCTVVLSNLVHRDLRPELMIKVFQRIFKVLKRIKQLSIDVSLLTREGGSRTYKDLLLLNRLQSLKISSFSYYGAEKNANNFLEAARLASQRRSWFHLKSLYLNLSPFISILHRPEENQPIESLKKLLVFTRDLKKDCLSIYKCLNVHWRLPYQTALGSEEEAKILIEIAQLLPSITSLQSGRENNRFKEFEIAQDSQGLREVTVEICNKFKQELDLSVSAKPSNFIRQKINSLLYPDTLAQIKPLKYITFLMFKLHLHRREDNEKFELSRVISDLPHLKSLHLIFINSRRFSQQEKNDDWFADVCEAIGKKSNLKNLMLYFSTFDFVKSEHLFTVFCKSIMKLTQLSVFNMSISKADTIEDKDLFTLCQCMSKLSKIQNFNLTLEKESDFGAKAIILLFDALMKSFTLLSNLDLRINKIQMNDQVYLALSEAVNQMKCLNWIHLSFVLSKDESKFDFKGLQAKIRKKRTTRIYFHRPHS